MPSGTRAIAGDRPPRYGPGKGSRSDGPEEIFSCVRSSSVGQDRLILHHSGAGTPELQSPAPLLLILKILQILLLILLILEIL